MKDSNGNHDTVTFFVPMTCGDATDTVAPLPSSKQNPIYLQPGGHTFPILAFKSLDLLCWKALFRYRTEGSKVQQYRRGVCLSQLMCYSGSQITDDVDL